ncbi:MAG: rane efflux protein [Proteobacteria bacterium]|nr:rane efflux protein [Pseudomonadota bacterium]
MNRRIVVYTAAALAFTGATAAAFLASVLILVQPGRSEEVADPRVKAPLVSVTKAKPPVAANRSFTGTIAARVQSDVGFRVPGKIVERLVGLGDEVKAGQPLMRMDETDLRLALTAKRNAAAAARAVFVQTAADEKRYAMLVKNGLAASPQRYDQAKAALDTSAAQLAAAEAEEKVAENEAAYATLVAEVDGTIVETLGEPGQVVTAGQPVIRLAKAGPREALVWLPENLRPEVGAIAQAAVYGRPTEEKAVLRQISSAADPQTRTYETRWVLEGSASSAPLGATVTISIQNKDEPADAEVPVGALLNDGRRTGVWIVNDQSSSVHFQEVKVERIGEERAVVSNLKVGETIVALGAHLLQEGASVRTGADKAEAAN